MKTVVIYEPLESDPTSGKILQTVQTIESNLEHEARPWIEVPEYRIDWDRTHKVLNGELVEQTPELPNGQ
jgi:hypothetical protein